MAGGRWARELGVFGGIGASMAERGHAAGPAGAAGGLGRIGIFSRGLRRNVVVGGGGLVSLAHARDKSMIFDRFWQEIQATDHR